MFEEQEEDQCVWGSQQGENGWGGMGNVQQGPHWVKGSAGSEMDLAWISYSEGNGRNLDLFLNTAEGVRGNYKGER